MASASTSPRTLRKAVLPVAGFGTRVLPATKAIPKELLPVFDRPAIQYVVDEALAAGIEHIIFVTGRNKGAIEDYFDRAYELEVTLREKGKTAQLAEAEQSVPVAGSMSFVRQQAALGLGHAVWCARDIVGDEPFAVLLPDMIMKSEKGCLAQMMAVYEQTGGNIVAVEECDPALAHQYGIVGVGERRGDAFAITQMVEKPPKGTAPSNFYISGRYILQPEIFDHLSRHEKGAGGEIQLTDAMIRLMAEQSFWATRFDGVTYDCGSKIGFLTANVAFGLDRPELVAEFRREIAKLIG